MMIPEMPGLAPVKVSHRRSIPGDVIPVNSESDAKAGVRGQYLIAALYESKIARELASQYEVVFEEAPAGLTLTGVKEDGHLFMMECWRHPQLKPIFSKLGLRVQEVQG